QNSAFEVASGTNSYGPLVTTTNSSWSSPVWEEGRQYVVFRDVGVGGSTVTITVLPDASPQASLNGMQIIKKGVTPNPDCVTAPSGLVSWWQAESNAVDSVSGNNGTFGGNASVASGKVGLAFSFDGNGDGIHIGNPTNLQLQTLTIEGWVKRSSATQITGTGIFGEIVGYGVSGYVFGFWSDGKLFLSKHGVDHVSSAHLITDTDWHHLAVTKAGNKVVFYIDGVAEPEQTYNTTFEFYTDLRIGAVNDGFAASFLGLIDELSIYNRALAAAEVQSIYSAGASGKCSLPPPPPNGRAIAHWKFDETSGNIAEDSAGPFDGTLTPSGASFVPGGISGGAISLNIVSNGFVNAGNVLGLTEGDFSVVSWVKTSPENTANRMVILSKHVGGFANGYMFAFNPSATYGLPGKAWFSDSAFPGQEVISTSTVADGGWHQIVVTYVAGANKSIYVDGVPVEASNASIPIAANPAPFLVGGVFENGNAGSSFNGLIDDVQIYNYALTSGDVDLLFNHPGQEVPPREIPVGWTLAVNAGAGGSVTRNPELSKYPNGTSVTLTAVPNAGFAFNGWSGDASGTTNPITITMNGNKTVTAGFREVPARTLFVVNPEPRQEGEKIHLDLKLISPGDVGGMNFVLRYNSQYLKEPKLEWSSVVGSALDQVNYDTPGQIRATFALPATAIPDGTQRVATVSFRTRSVPSDLTTELGLELVDVSSPTGDSIRNGNLAQGGSARILVRRIIGDNNANDRLDVGDATIIQRLLIRLDPVRSWDITGNDLNANTNLDSGDAVKVLRVVADLDPQPSPGGGPGPALVGGSRNGLRKAGPVSDNIEIALDKTRAQPGELVTAQVRLKGISSTLAGASFALEFPTNALRLVNAQSQKTGPLVPASAFTVWNVTPAQNNYTIQDGRVSVGISTPTVWSTNNGALAEFTFVVQPEQAGQYRWPISVEEMEITENGYETRSLGGTETYYIGRDPIAPTLTSASVAFSPNGLSLTLAGEIGVP
ncbi:MAG TPA: LamG-like jellyroll fold domain-containing protein, partial [Verrucomicrobiae bacterium]|nr:LamG-like jellyroll fold domain-containing protein [Verrucomicrobiae bacterium]